MAPPQSIMLGCALIMPPSIGPDTGCPDTGCPDIGMLLFIAGWPPIAILSFIMGWPIAISLFAIWPPMLMSPDCIWPIWLFMLPPMFGWLMLMSFCAIGMPIMLSCAIG